jgi:hypothetical protein
MGAALVVRLLVAQSMRGVAIFSGMTEMEPARRAGVAFASLFAH